MRIRKTVIALLVFSATTAALSQGADLPVENDYYTVTAFELPAGAVIEPGAFQLMPDGRLAVASRRGEIWMISEPFAREVQARQFTRFAHGLHEVLGLAERDGWLYVVQRCDVSRIKDSDGDGQADIFEVVSDDWEISGDQHEYAFGSKFDRQGQLWVTLCLTGSFSSAVPYRGWCVRVSADGKMTPTASGIRSPGGMGMNAAGDVFYTDNQGPWNGTCSLRPLRPGKFLGHPAGNTWYKLAEPVLGPAPSEPESGSRLMTEAARIPQLDLPAILFPYKKMGQSASGITYDMSGGKFGPFTNQMFVGDHTFSLVMRVDLEQINGVYQGACFPFREGLSSGIVGLEMTPQGALFAGGTARGWGSRGTREFSIERINWTGKTPFEIQTMHLLPGGFELTFTDVVDPVAAAKIDSYTLETYCYIYQSSYGSPEVDHTTPRIESVTVAGDGRSVRLTVAGLQRGQIHELHAAGVRSAAGLPLLHEAAYYTLNEFAQ